MRDINANDAGLSVKKNENFVTLFLILFFINFIFLDICLLRFGGLLEIDKG
jgi:hypothetical protein